MEAAQLGRPELLALVACQERIITALVRAHSAARCEAIAAENRARLAEISFRDRLRKAGVKLPGRPPKEKSPSIPLDSGIAAK
jgi:hypothetical protein